MCYYSYIVMDYFTEGFLLLKKISYCSQVPGLVPQTEAKTLECCVFTLMPHSSENWGCSVYAKVGSQALDCPFESISLPLLSCWCLRRQTAFLHTASLHLSSTIRERWPTLPPTTSSLPAREGMKPKSTRGEGPVGKLECKYWFSGMFSSLWENRSPSVFVWRCAAVKTVLWLSGWTL